MKNRFLWNLEIFGVCPLNISLKNVRSALAPPLPKETNRYSAVGKALSLSHRDRFAAHSAVYPPQNTPNLFFLQSLIQECYWLQ